MGYISNSVQDIAVASSTRSPNQRSPIFGIPTSPSSRLLSSSSQLELPGWVNCKRGIKYQEAGDRGDYWVAF